MVGLIQRGFLDAGTASERLLRGPALVKPCGLIVAARGPSLAASSRGGAMTKTEQVRQDSDKPRRYSLAA